ncbi:MAG: hypothetical protein JWP85_1156 [Rhodoglobus sp.]|nr:hypothetical protein [Rhodoglobus sp.]
MIWYDCYRVHMMSEVQVTSRPWWKRPLAWAILAAVLVIAVIVAVLVTRGAAAPSPSAAATPTSSPATSVTPMATATATATSTPTPTVTAEPPPEPDAQQSPSAEQRQHFLEVMQTGNTQPFMQDFADEVTVALWHTDCCGVLGAFDAIGHLPIRPELTATWDFTLDEATLEGFRTTGAGDYFPVNALVGVSSDGDIVAFTPGGDGRITTVLVSTFSNL